MVVLRPGKLFQSTHMEMSGQSARQLREESQVQMHVSTHVYVIMIETVLLVAAVTEIVFRTVLTGRLMSIGNHG